MPEQSPASRRAPGEVRSVFVLRPDHLGDVVLFTGALRHLRALYPRARIRLCVKRYVGALLEHCPYVDELVFWEELHPRWPAWTRKVRGLTRLERALRAVQLRLRYRSDVALLPVRAPTPEMHRVMAALPAAERYGIAGCTSNQGADTDREAGGIYTSRLVLGPERESEHELDVTRDFLRMLGSGVETSELHPELWTAPEDRRWAEAYLPREPGTVLLALTPGVTAPAGKAYPASGYAEVLARVPERRFSVVLLGGAADARLCAEVEHALRGAPNVASVVDLAGKSTLGGMVESLRRAEVVLGPDSAPLHVGIAVGTPTVCILGGGHYGRFHPWGDRGRNRVAHRPMDCYGCDWRCPFATVRCVQEIAPGVVARELEAALAFPWDPAPYSSGNRSWPLG
jgi:ADP-heptose:LPS heptosyltransferase